MSLYRIQSTLRLLCVGISTAAAVLVPIQAQALDFRFFFNREFVPIQLNPDGTSTILYQVEGLITGLNNNQTDQRPLSLEVTKSTNDALALGTYTFSKGEGFSVTDGQISTANWTGMLDSPEQYRRLEFWDKTGSGSIWGTIKNSPPAPPVLPFPLDPVWIEGVGYVVPICSCVTTNLPEPNPGSLAVFVPISSGLERPTPPFIRSTPGPLPILGAVAAYRCSRRLRRRLREGSSAH